MGDRHLDAQLRGQVRERPRPLREKDACEAQRIQHRPLELDARLRQEGEVEAHVLPDDLALPHEQREVVRDLRE